MDLCRRGSEKRRLSGRTITNFRNIRGICNASMVKTRAASRVVWFHWSCLANGGMLYWLCGFVYAFLAEGFVVML
jgi:hypothetical protein